MHTVVSVKPLEKYCLEIVFDDASKIRFDVSPYLYGEVFEPLKDYEVFKQVKVDDVLGTIVWPTGADFCPDFLYQMQTDKIAADISACVTPKRQRA